MPGAGRGPGAGFLISASPVLIPLEQADPATAGGKAAALHRLADHGLPVPRSWVLPVDAFVVFLAANHLDASTPGLVDRLRAAPLPFPLVSPAPLVAVRSSAMGEDGRRSSHAGQYESVLGVTPEAFTDAVKTVWASWFSARARAYRGEGGPPGMAVLVQEVVDARVSGVLFTINPLVGTWRQMTVEAVWGLGDQLVAGQLVPDRYVLRRPRRTPRPAQRVLARIPLTVESETIAGQARERVVSRGALESRPTEAPLARKLLREELVALGRLGLRAESLQHDPQDLEWVQDRAGRFWIVQARPITTRAELPRGGATLWTRRFIGERFPEGVTPMGWSIIAPVLEWFIAYPETSARFLGGDPPLRRLGGHPYLNVTVFRHLAFKLPGAPPPGFMLDFFPPEEVEAWTRRAAAPPDFRVYRSILATTFAERRWRRFRWNPWSNWRAWEGFRDALPRRLAALERSPPGDVLHHGIVMLRDYVKVHITSLLFANLYYEVVGPLLPGETQEVLLRAPAGTITRRVNAELWDLAHHPDRLAGFLLRHGHRSEASWEVFSRRWAEDPAAVRRLAELVADGPDPWRLMATESRETEAAMARLDPSLRVAVATTQQYLRLREEQRYHLDRLLWALKRKLLERGAAWFDDPADVRFLEAGELDAGLDRAELRQIAARRATEPVDPSPPDFLRGDEALVFASPHAARLQGLGISPGVARGRVRVVLHPADGERLRPGEVLVSRSTDPAWTPLFQRAGALVLEMGGLLSHGAVVAREYRLPGVVNVPGATRLLHDGDEVTVDGRSGTVWVHGGG